MKTKVCLNYFMNDWRLLNHSLKTQKNLKESGNMYHNSVYIPDFWLKNADVSRTQGVYHVMSYFFNLL